MFFRHINKADIYMRELVLNQRNLYDSRHEADFMFIIARKLEQAVIHEICHAAFPQWIGAPAESRIVEMTRMVME